MKKKYGANGQIDVGISESLNETFINCKIIEERYKEPPYLNDFSDIRKNHFSIPLPRRL
jgi:hypothetical protein